MSIVLFVCVYAVVAGGGDDSRDDDDDDVHDVGADADDNHGNELVGVVVTLVIDVVAVVF